MTEDATWRTRLDPAHSGAYGVEELHAVFFEPIGDRAGPRSCLVVQIPETSDQKILTGLRQATKEKARVFFLCDTREQADQIAQRAGKLLRRHRRISFERAAAGGWGLALPQWLR